MDDDWNNFFQLDPSKTLHYPMRLGSKSGLFKSRIGLNMTVRRGLFHYGKIKIECVGDIVENGVQGIGGHGGGNHGGIGVGGGGGGVGGGWGGGNMHLIETLQLPAALKRMKTRKETFVGENL